MTILTTETVAKSLAVALSTENPTENLFDSVQVISTDDGDVISVKQSSDGSPVFITVDKDQVRTVSYLWDLEEISEDAMVNVLKVMLRESMSLPLVSFGLDDEEVTLFGSMSTASGFDELLEEVQTLFSATDLVVSQIKQFVEA
jgi:uncharacterized protein YjfI (DUF2170 family)